MVNALACTVDIWLHWEGLLSSLDRSSNPLPFYTGPAERICKWGGGGGGG